MSEHDRQWPDRGNREGQGPPEPSLRPQYDEPSPRWRERPPAPAAGNDWFFGEGSDATVEVPGADDDPYGSSGARARDERHPDASPQWYGSPERYPAGWGAEDEAAYRSPSPLPGAFLLASGLLALAACALAWAWWSGQDQPMTWTFGLLLWVVCGVILLGTGLAALRATAGRGAGVLAAGTGLLLVILSLADVLAATDSGAGIGQRLNAVWSLQLVAGLAATGGGAATAARRF